MILYIITAGNVTNRLVKQTKIELVNLKHLTPFIGVTRSYIYYFDDTAGRYGVYGGFHWDMLTQYYFQTKKKFTDTFATIISNFKPVSKDSAAFYLNHRDTLQLHRLLTPEVVSHLMAIDPSPLIDQRIFHLQPIPFDNVKPIGNVTFRLGYALFPIFIGPFYDTQEVGAIGLRNAFSLVNDR